MQIFYLVFLLSCFQVALGKGLAKEAKGNPGKADDKEKKGKDGGKEDKKKDDKGGKIPVEVAFQSFQSTFGKTYTSDAEKAKRFQIFVANLEIAAKKTALDAAAGGSAVYGTNEFSDLTAEEFSSIYLSGPPIPANQPQTNSKLPIDVEDVEVPEIDPHKLQQRQLNLRQSRKLITNLITNRESDWSTGAQRITTDIKNQGPTGLCFTLAALAQLESDAMRTQKDKGISVPDPNAYTLSFNQLLLCAPCVRKGILPFDFPIGKQTFSGGDANDLYKFARVHGVPLSKDFKLNCPDDKNPFAGVLLEADLASTSLAADPDSLLQELAIAQHVLDVGPMTTGINGGQFKDLLFGTTFTCASKTIDHEIQIVGVKFDENGGFVWKIRNSWGSRAGENGFYFLKGGSNECGIGTDVGTRTNPCFVRDPNVPTTAETVFGSCCAQRQGGGPLLAEDTAADSVCSRPTQLPTPAPQANTPTNVPTCKTNPCTFGSDICLQAGETSIFQSDGTGETQVCVENLNTCLQESAVVAGGQVQVVAGQRSCQQRAFGGAPFAVTNTGNSVMQASATCVANCKEKQKKDTVKNGDSFSPVSFTNAVTNIVIDNISPIFNSVISIFTPKSSTPTSVFIPPGTRQIIPFPNNGQPITIQNNGQAPIQITTVCNTFAKDGVTPICVPLPTAKPTAAPTAVPLNPTTVPLNPTAVPLNPTAVPLNPTAVPLSPTAVPLSPTPVPLCSPSPCSGSNCLINAGDSTTFPTFLVTPTQICFNNLSSCQTATATVCRLILCISPETFTIDPGQTRCVDRFFGADLIKVTNTGSSQNPFQVTTACNTIVLGLAVCK